MMNRKIVSNLRILGFGLLFCAAAMVQTAVAQTKTDASPTAAEIFHRMERENASRAAALDAYQSMRKYSVYEPKHTPDAVMTASMQYKAPSTKTFKVISKTGVGFIHSMVFNKLMNAEQETASGKSKADSTISSSNYTPALIGEEVIDGRDNYILQLTPKKQSQYLMNGKIWVDKEDFAIARLEGDPAKRVSFWVPRSHVIREYQKIGQFWLPLMDDTHCTIRFEGEYILHIDYLDYKLGVPEAKPQ